MKKSKKSFAERAKELGWGQDDNPLEGEEKYYITGFKKYTREISNEELIDWLILYMKLKNGQ